MAVKVDITAEQLRSILRYDKNTGDFFWLPKSQDVFKDERSYSSWTARFSGKLAGSFKNGRYGRINVGGKVYFKHHLAWLYFYGSLPKEEIDHADGNPANNKIENLRLASRMQNMHNTKVRCDSLTQVKGVQFDSGSYKARLRVNGVCVLNKRFDNLESARSAYAEAAEKYHGKFARTD